jgi:hypothetical protein
LAHCSNSIDINSLAKGKKKGKHQKKRVQENVVNIYINCGRRSVLLEDRPIKKCGGSL